MKTVRPKKKLGQHFLTDLSIAEKIANTLSFDTYDRVLEIGPGMGVLTQYLPWKENKVSLIELDSESILYLQAAYPSMVDSIHEGDFLKIDIPSLMGEDQFAIIGNFPYNISTQIVFRTIENREQIPFLLACSKKKLLSEFVNHPAQRNTGSSRFSHSYFMR